MVGLESSWSPDGLWAEIWLGSHQRKNWKKWWMNSRNPPGVCWSPSGVKPEYVGECKVLYFWMSNFGNWSCDHHPNMLLNEPWQAESSLTFWSYKITFPCGVYVEDPDMDPEGRASLIFLLMAIFANVHQPSKQYPTLLTMIKIMSILFFWFYGSIFTNYYIWKCAQTM